MLPSSWRRPAGHSSWVNSNQWMNCVTSCTCLPCCSLSSVLCGVFWVIQQNDRHPERRCMEVLSIKTACCGLHRWNLPALTICLSWIYHLSSWASWLYCLAPCRSQKQSIGCWGFTHTSSGVTAWWQLWSFCSGSLCLMQATGLFAWMSSVVHHAVPCVSCRWCFC